MFHKRRALDPTWPKQWFDHKPVLWRVAECVLWRESVAGVFKNDKEISGKSPERSIVNRYWNNLQYLHPIHATTLIIIPCGSFLYIPNMHVRHWSSLQRYLLDVSWQTAKQHHSTAVQVSKPMQSESMEAALGRSWISSNSMWSSIFFGQIFPVPILFWQVGYAGLVVWSTVNVFYWSPPNSAYLFEVVEKTSL